MIKRDVTLVMATSSSLIIVLVITLYYWSEEESISEEGETEIALLGENGERQMKPVRMLKFSGICFLSYLIHLIK